MMIKFYTKFKGNYVVESIKWFSKKWFTSTKIYNKNR